MTAPVSKTFCILPWVHVYANPDGNVLPCCVGDYRLPMGNIQNSTLEQTFNNDKFKTMRKNMLQGKSCKECSACYRDEADNNDSFRKSSNLQFKKYIPNALTNTNDDGSLDDYKLRYLDIRWSNICNYKCRSCSGTYSSSWAKEEGKKNVFTFAGGTSNDNLYNQFLPHFDTIEEFYFAGGEPLLTDKHYDILEYLIKHNRTDVKLRYNTNVSVLKYKNKNILDLWKQFSNVYIGASLDHYGSRAEYIRNGTDWKNVETNMRKIRTETPHISLQTNTVVSLFNVSTLPEFMHYLVDNELVNDNYDPLFYNILNPDFYSFDVLPEEFKKQTVEKLLEFNNEQKNVNLQPVINGLTSATYTPELVSTFLQKTEHYDIIRNENFNKTFPELVGLFQ